MKPAPGTGNVQGKVFFNSQPAENIEVRLCETFSRFLSGCGGQIYTARTDKDGDYVITNVAPKTYEALTARVFDTDSYIFATSGIAGHQCGEIRHCCGQNFLRNPDQFIQERSEDAQPQGRSKGEFTRTRTEMGFLSGRGLLQVQYLR